MYYIKSTDPNPITPAKAVLLGLLCLIWLSTGLVGHDPWKPDEAYSFGLVYSMLQSGDWLVPTLAGEPYMDKPPLFYWTAALFARIFEPMLPLHDGARLASGFYTALTLLFIGLTGRKLYGEHRGWAAVIILIGCLGLLVRAHQITTDLALLTGCAMMLYGFARSQERATLAGALLGTGLGIGFMSKGFIAPIFFVLTAAALPLFFNNWRKRNYLLSLIIAVLVALPWLAVWPFLLFHRSPELFADWAWAHNLGNWIDYAKNGPNRDSFYYLQNLPWLAWPALPLAAWAVWKSRKRLAQRDDLQLPLISFSVMLVALSFSATVEEVFALPMLLPVALMATASLSILKRGAANALDWFGLMTFALIAVLMWSGWTGLLLDNRTKITRWLKDYQPDFTPELHTQAFFIALIATVLWVIMIWRTGRSMRRATLNWASGVTLIWVLAMTLWLPWLDSGKSYRSMVGALKQSLPKHYQCIAGENLGNGQRAMLHYFGNIITQRDPKRRCDLRLIQGSKLSDPAFTGTRWKKIWEGSRKGNKNEYYRLYRRIDD
ncbi:MAG: glycosyltransferase family 39 protein [Nitrosomonadales bacterium]|nr:glycosyltransferase family 39 protein [Nitrosomonadales bacterium]